MNQLQIAAHTEGVNLVAYAFNHRQKFNVDVAVGWIHHHAANDHSEESLQIFSRDADGNLTSAKKNRGDTIGVVWLPHCRRFRCPGMHSRQAYHRRRYADHQHQFHGQYQ
jgi:hypothetical protein